MRNAARLPLAIAVALTLGLVSAQVVYAQQEVIATVPEGEFVFRDMTIRPGKTPVFKHVLVGQVENRTSKDWESLYFEFSFFDSQGNRIGEPQVFPIPFARRRGQMNDFNVTSLNPPSSPVARYAIRFIKGQPSAVYSFLMSKPKENRDLHYEDEIIDITFAVTREQIGFDLRNKSEQPVSIDWNSTSYVDVSGNSHRVMHAGVKYADRDKSQPPSIVPPTARLKDTIHPTDYVDFSKNFGWSTNSLFPRAPEAAHFDGKAFSVFMPLQVEGKIKNYLFTFTIEAKM